MARGAVEKATNYDCGENGAGNYNAEGGVDANDENCGGDQNVWDEDDNDIDIYD